MQEYKDVINKVLKYGEQKGDRTGTGTISVSGAYFEHDMSKGFPLLTTKRMPFNLIASELEFFIKGITDKQWLLDRNNHIWDEWCSPDKVSYGHDKETKEKMMVERDLGPIYGFQWRHFDAEYNGYDKDYTGQGIDQLEDVVKTLKTNPHDRRMIVDAWNPKQKQRMALPPCHYGFQVLANKNNNTLDLLWRQRSVDTILGLPFNIASYGLLLHLLAKESGFKEGKLIGFLADVHIYNNHLEGEFMEKINKQLSRELKPLPGIETENFNSIFDWNFGQSKVVGYESHPGLKFPIAV